MLLSCTSVDNDPGSVAHNASISTGEGSEETYRRCIYILKRWKGKIFILQGVSFCPLWSNGVGTQCTSSCCLVAACVCYACSNLHTGCCLVKLMKINDFCAIERCVLCICRGMQHVRMCVPLNMCMCVHAVCESVCATEHWCVCVCMCTHAYVCVFGKTSCVREMQK